MDMHGLAREWVSVFNRATRVAQRRSCRRRSWSTRWHPSGGASPDQVNGWAHLAGGLGLAAVAVPRPADGDRGDRRGGGPRSGAIPTTGTNDGPLNGVMPATHRPFSGSPDPLVPRDGRAAFRALGNAGRPVYDAPAGCRRPARCRVKASVANGDAPNSWPSPCPAGCGSGRSVTVQEVEDRGRELVRGEDVGEMSLLGDGDDLDVGRQSLRLLSGRVGRRRLAAATDHQGRDGGDRQRAPVASADGVQLAWGGPAPSRRRLRTGGTDIAMWCSSADRPATRLAITSIA